MGGRQYRAVPVPDVCTRYTCSPKHLWLPLSSSILVRGVDANSGMPIAEAVRRGAQLGGRGRWLQNWFEIVKSTAGDDWKSSMRGWIVALKRTAFLSSDGDNATDD